MINITDYGKSMYGGWYANYTENGEYKGVHADTIKGLCVALGVTRKELTSARRYDN